MSLLKERSTYSRSLSFAIATGICPERLFRDKISEVRDEHVPMELGMLPSREFRDSIRSFREVAPPIS